MYAARTTTSGWLCCSAPMLGANHTTTSGGETGVPSTFRTWRDVTCE